MASDIDIASQALQLIGASPINSFSDPGAGAKVASNIYESTLRNLLTSTYWTFTLKKQELNLLTSPPVNEFQYQFQIPTDCLKVLKVYPQTYYKIYGDKILTNTKTLSIDYVHRPETNLLPDYFTWALTYKLAADFAMSVTYNENVNALYEQKFRAQIAEAYAADGQQNPQTPIQDQPFTDVRFGGGYPY